MRAVTGFSKFAAQVSACAAAALLATGCVSSRAFVPSEHVTAFAPDGDDVAAEYSIIEGGDDVGELKLWSEGATRKSSDAEPHTVIELGFELSNHGREPLRFDDQGLYIEELPKKGVRPGRTRPATVTGERLVQPGQSREIHATFALPSSVLPNDIPGYRVRWRILGRRAHARETAFLHAPPAPRYTDPWYPAWPYYGYYGYYYPGFYGSWSFGYRWPPPWRGPRYYVPYRR